MDSEGVASTVDDPHLVPLTSLRLASLNNPRRVRVNLSLDREAVVMGPLFRWPVLATGPLHERVQVEPLILRDR